MKCVPVKQVPQSFFAFPAGSSFKPHFSAALLAPATSLISEVISVLLSWRLSPSLPLFMPLLLLFERNVLTA